MTSCECHLVKYLTQKEAKDKHYYFKYTYLNKTTKQIEALFLWFFTVNSQCQSLDFWSKVFRSRLNSGITRILTPVIICCCDRLQITKLAQSTLTSLLTDTQAQWQSLHSGFLTFLHVIFWRNCSNKDKISWLITVNAYSPEWIAIQVAIRLKVFQNQSNARLKTDLKLLTKLSYHCQPPINNIRWVAIFMIQI